MAPKKSDFPNKVGKPQSAYAKDGFAGGYRPGDEWFNEEQNVMDNRKTKQTPDGTEYDGSGRARKLQQDDLSRQQLKGVAGSGVPSYKKGGKIRKTGLARVHKGERVIPKAKVKRVEKAMKSMKRG